MVLWTNQETFLSQAKVAQTACMSACQHIAKEMLDMLADTEVKTMSLASLHQVNMDIKECECKCYGLYIL